MPIKYKILRLIVVGIYGLMIVLMLAIVLILGNALYRSLVK
jgi:hypothetical protein